MDGTETGDGPLQADPSAGRPSEPPAPARPPAPDGSRSWRPSALVAVLAVAFVTTVALAAWALTSRGGPEPATIQTGSSSHQAAPTVHDGPAAGSQPPRLTLPALRPGAPPVSLAGGRGKPVLINFFASWCHPCLTELPLLAKTWRHQGTRISFVGVDVNDNPAHARALLAKDHVGYPVGTDPNDAATLRFRLTNLPSTVFIGSDGRVVHTRTGELTPQILNHWLARLAGHRH